MAGLVRLPRQLGSLMEISRASTVLFLALTIGLAVGCGQPTGVPDDDSAAGNTQGVPFDRESHPDVSTSETPWARVARLPEGTPITIRLLTPLSSALSHGGDSFQGTLDDPIAIEGEILVIRGAAVTGRVLAAKAAGQFHDPGYLRIAVVSLTIDGKPIPISTSSLFVKGRAHERRNPVSGAGSATAFMSNKDEVSFVADRRLTFRLAQALESPKDTQP
jgi:hypothetical protein